MSIAKASTASSWTARHTSSLILASMCLGVLLAQLDNMVVNLALKHIGAELHSGVSGLQWVLDAYNLTYASLLLTGGALGDLFGRRRIFAAGAAAIILGTAVCGLAPDTAVLIAGRTLTGLGAALVIPSSLAILAVTYADANQRAHALGIWASCNGLAMVIGPTIGGLLVDSAGWRSIFLLTLPIAALTFAMALWAVPESSHAAGRHLDLPGQTLAIAGLGALSFAAIEGSRMGWTAPPIVAGFAAFALLLPVFIAVQRRTQGPLVPLGLFRHGTFVASLLVAALMTFGMYGMLFLLPIELQVAHGASAFMAGIELLPNSVVFLVVSNLSGWLAVRLGARAMMTAGMAAMGGGLLLIAALPADAPYLALAAGLAIIGVGLGLNTGPVNSVAVASVPPARSGTASGLVNTARMIGATLGIAALGAVFAAFAGQSPGDAASVTHGLRAAFLVGAAGELTGALIALGFVRAGALQGRAAAR
jgi:MFS transporter, DHA2 family, methylenomycin A resistance protein